MDLVEKLEILGLSKYESKVYVALVGMGAASAREIHEASGVPRTRVYDILKKLLEKGFLEVQQGNPTFFKAIDPEKVIGKLAEDMERISRECIYELENLKLERRKDVPPIWVVRGDWTIKTKLKEFIYGAKNEIILVCPKISVILEIAEYLPTSGVKIKCLVFGMDEKLVELLPDIEFKVLSKDCNLKTPLFKRLFEIFGGVEEDGVKYETECIAVIDGKRSFLVISENNTRIAVLIRLPLIAYFQKNIVEAIMEEVG